MVSVQKKTKKRKFFVNPYNQNNNENRQPPKPKSKVVNPPRQQFNRPMQSKPTLQPQMVSNAPNLNNQNHFDQSSFNNQRSAPRYQQNSNFQNQNGYPQYVSQQYMNNTQQYYGQPPDNLFMRQQQQNFVQQTLTTQMQQGFHNLNTVELMRMRQMIQSELYYLRIQNETNYYQSVRPVNGSFF